MVKEAAPDQAGYRMALWLVPADGSAPPRRLTLGARRDVAPRWSPDGRWLAFLSDRGAVLRAGGAPRDAEDLRRAGAAPTGLKDLVGRDIPRGDTQVWLLPMDGGEAQQLTDLPGRRRRAGLEPGRPPALRRLRRHQRHAPGRRPPRREPGRAATPRHAPHRRAGLPAQRRRLHLRAPAAPVDRGRGTAGRPGASPPGSRGDEQPAWSPDGTRIAFVSNRGAGADLAWRSDVYVVAAEGGPATRVTDGPERLFRHPAWSPDGSLIAAIGHRFEALGPTRDDVWVFAPEAGAGGPRPHRGQRPLRRRRR